MHCRVGRITKEGGGAGHRKKGARLCIKRANVHKEKDAMGFQTVDTYH